MWDLWSLVLWVRLSDGTLQYKEYSYHVAKETCEISKELLEENMKKSGIYDTVERIICIPARKVGARSDD